jgi:hypothetical protein
MRTSFASRIVVVFTIALAVGCGHGTDSAPAASGQAARLNRAGVGARGDADLVSAVSAAGDTAPVGLKFGLAAPPRVGQPLRVELVLAQQAGLDIDSVLVSFQPGDGLTIESEHNFEFQSPPPGATQHMAVTVRAQQPGLLSLGATVLVATASGSVTRSFSIPLIAAP